MAYTAVKLDDVKKAIAAVTAAQKKYTDAQASSKGSQAIVTNAQKTLDSANQKLQQLQSDFDNQKYLTTNAGYQNALKAITAAEKARDTAQTKLDAATNANRAALQKAYDKANTAVDTAYTNKDKAQAAAEKAAYAPITAQQAAVNKQQGVFDTAQQKYQTLMDSFQPLIDQRNDAINNVSNYAQTIKDSFGDVNNITDAKTVQTLLKDINAAVGALKLPELQDQFKSQLGDFDPIKAFNEKLPELQKQFKENVELPTLSASQVDAALNRAGTQGVPRTGLIGDGNSIYIPKNQGRGDDLAQFAGTIDGLNLKSVNANILTGAALYGVYKDLSQKGKVSYTGDFAKAAKTAGVDITGMSKEDAYNALNEKGQGYYAITTRGSLGIDPATGKQADHWSALYKREGDQLVPATDQNGQKVVQGFNATWHQPFEDFGTFIQGAMPAIMMALPFVLPGIGAAASSALGGAQVASAVAPTAFTVGAPAVTLSTAIGATAVSAVSNAAINAGIASLVGGDPIKAAISGAAGTVISASSSDIVKGLGISDGAIQKIASAANLNPDQVKKIISDGVSTGVSSAVNGDPDILKNITASVVGQFAGSQAQNLASDALKNANPKALAAAVSAAGNVANVATQTAINGGDINAAIQNAAPSILANASEAANQVGVKQPTTTAPEKQATQEFPLDYTIGAKENFSNEARIFYEKAIEGGLSEADALAVASAMDAQKTNQYYGRQFGPELAALSPQTLQKIDSLNKLYPNATETQEEFDKWRKGYNEAIQSEIALGDKGKLSLNEDGQTYSDIDTGAIYFKDAEGNWDVRKISGGSGTSGQTPNVDELGNVSSAAQNYNLASLFSTGTSTPGAASTSVFGSGASTNVPDYAQADPDEFRLITRDVFRDYGLPENAFEIVNFDTVSPELKAKISADINARVADKKSIFNTSQSAVFGGGDAGGGGGGGGTTGGGVTSGGTTSIFGDDIPLSGGIGIGAGGINAGTNVEFGSGTGTGTSKGDVFGVNTGTGTGGGIGTGTGTGTGSGTGSGTGTGVGTGTGSGTGSGTGAGTGAGTGTGTGTGTGVVTAPTGPTGPTQEGGAGNKVSTPDTTWNDPLAAQASGTDFDYTKIGDQNPLLNPLLFSLAGFTQKQKTNKQSGSSASPFSLLGLGTSAFGQSDTSTEPMGSLEAMYNQPTAAEQFASNPLPTALPSTATSQVPIAATYYDPLSTSTTPQTQDTTNTQTVDNPWGFAQGGLASTHPAGEPQFYSEGGLGNMYVKGDGDGTSDDVPAMLANNEFVIPADVVSALGNGSSEAGAGVLENFMYEIRKHKQSHDPRELPPQSRGPLEYLSAAMQKGHRA